MQGEKRKGEKNTEPTDTWNNKENSKPTPKKMQYQHKVCVSVCLFVWPAGENDAALAKNSAAQKSKGKCSGRKKKQPGVASKNDLNNKQNIYKTILKPINKPPDNLEYAYFFRAAVVLPQLVNVLTAARSFNPPRKYDNAAIAYTYT